jgi:hypothetical protein
MARLLGALLLVGGLAAATALVPWHGRTVLDRWKAAPSAAEFARRGWHEVAQATGFEDPPRRAPAARPAAGPPRAARPVERHTAADRAALDRLVSDRAADR